MLYTSHYDNNIIDGRRPVGTPAAVDYRESVNLNGYTIYYTYNIMYIIIRKQRNDKMRLQQCSIEIIETIVYSHKIVRLGHLRGV